MTPVILSKLSQDNQKKFITHLGYDFIKIIIKNGDQLVDILSKLFQPLVPFRPGRRDWKTACPDSPPFNDALK